MRASYAATELGTIPEDWSVLSISELHPFVTSGSRGWAAFYADSGSPFIRISNLSRDSIYPNLDDLRFVSLPENDGEGARTKLRAGDVLISITADIGIIGYVTKDIPDPSYINQHIALVRFDSSRASSLYTSYFLASERPQRQFRALTDAGAKAGMNLTTVASVRVACPPTVREQEAIAEALCDADALIESLDQLLAKKRQIKRATMQLLLTGKRRLPSFAGEWHQTVLGAVAAFRTGPFGSALHKSDYVTHGVPVINPMHIIDGVLVPSIGMTVTEQAAMRLADFRLRASDIVIGRRGDMGRCAVVQGSNEGWLCGTGSLIIRCSLEAVPHFLQRVLSSAAVIGAIEEGSVGTTMINLNQKVLWSLKITLPSVEEQNAIVEMLSEMDAELGGIEAKLAKARQIKQGMMQQLLTGRIRLV